MFVIANTMMPTSTFDSKGTTDSFDTRRFWDEDRFINATIRICAPGRNDAYTTHVKPCPKHVPEFCGGPERRIRAEHSAFTVGYTAGFQETFCVDDVVAILRVFRSLLQVGRSLFGLPQTSRTGGPALLNGLQQDTTAMSSEPSAGCGIWLSTGVKCDGALHQAPADIDPTPRCILHSADSMKDRKIFQDALGRLSMAGNTLDYTKIVFPTVLALASDAYPRLICNGAVFLAGVSFGTAKFPHGASFIGATFLAKASFVETRFAQADFGGASFDGPTQFTGCSFDNAIFAHSTFANDVAFHQTSFGRATFASARFSGRLRFDLVRFGKGSQWDAGDFTDVHFSDPKKVTFFRIGYKDTRTRNTPGTDGGAFFCPRLRGCDLRDVRFDDVRWMRRNGRIVVQDEFDAAGRYSDYPQGGFPLTSYPSWETVTGIYRQLRTCFESALAFDLVDECNIAIMELRQRDTNTSRLTRFMLAAYGIASRYGTSYERAVQILVALVLIVFPILFSVPFSGLAKASVAGLTTPAEAEPAFDWARSVLEAQPSYVLRLSKHSAVTAARSLGPGVVHSLEVATFQRSPFHTTTTVPGRLVTILETTAVTAQAALLLLAIRRRFRH